MQAQAHISGQVPGQVSGQMPGVGQQTMSSLPAQGWRRTWQTDADVTIRKLIVENISLLFQKRKPHVSHEWQQKLPDFVKRLEESLYRDATSKEEYADLNTLEQRLQAVAKRMAPTRNSQNYIQHGINTMSSSTLGPMIPTPGMTCVTNGSTMVPTPGSEITTVPTPGNGSMVPNSGSMGNLPPSTSGTILQGHAATPVGNLGSMIPAPGRNSKYFSAAMEPTSMSGNSLASQQGMGSVTLGSNAQMVANMGLSNMGSQMIPTPGLNSSQSMGMSTNSSAGMVFSNIDSVAAVQQQQLSAGSSGHMYRNTNGHFGGNLSSNIHRKNPPFGFPNGSGINNGLQLMSNGQQLVNGNANFSNTTGYANPSRFSNTQMQNHQRFVQQSRISGQATSFAGDGYAMNAADLAGPGNFCNSVSSGGVTANNASMNTLGLQTSKMIPVPGLPSQQSSFHPQHQLQQPQSQPVDQSQQMNLQYNASGLSRTQQQQLQQQLVKNKALYQTQLPSNSFGQKQPGVGTQHEDNRSASGLVPTSATSHRPLPEQHQSLSMQYQQTQQQHQNLSQLSPLQNQLPPQQQQMQVTQKTHSASPQQLWQQQPQKHQQLEQAFNQQQQQKVLKPEIQQDLCPQHQEVHQQKTLQQQSSQRIMQCQQSYQEPQQQLSNQEDVKQLQQSQHATNGSVLTGQTACRMGSALSLTSASGGNVEGQRAQQYLKQQRWLLFLRHASRCTAQEGQCHTTPHCHTARQLWGHITKCTDRECQYARCQASRTLLRHHQQCRDPNCPVCGPVRQMFLQQRAQAQTGQGQTATSISIPDLGSGASQLASAPNTVCTESSMTKLGTTSNGGIQVLQPPLKRAKTEPVVDTAISRQVDIPQDLISGASKNQLTTQLPPPQTQTPTTSSIKQESCTVVKDEGSGIGNSPVKLEVHAFSQENAIAQRSLQPKTEANSQTEAEPGLKQAQSTARIKMEASTTGTSTGAVQVKQEIVSHASPSSAPDPSISAKSSKPKIKGVSLTELFTPEQIREHISGLRQWVGQSKAKAEKNQAMEHHMSENSCQLCAVERLTFEPPPIYCTPCGARIKRNAPYWTVGSGETRQYFCIPCYNDIRNDTVELDGVTYLKSRLEKRKNDEETEEAWVQCDKCEAWQHQVCALFNGRRNEGGQAEYTCPQCCIKEIERGERKPLPQSAVLGAKDLPKTLLSDHIEQRLARKLRQERLERARAQGKSYDEVPGAECLIARVVSSVDKKLEVKQRFLEIFQEEDYPTEYAYKSKVLLLFQKIEGVEVCLFGMYVQEFGSDCLQPNQRRVYLSYLDSVKYFRPEVKTVTGEALRTFVYHEILIGYLDYCKGRGLTSCYIWACPPLKGEDYILYCHPEIQKTPKADKLREWYLAMLRKATNENIVMEVTNLYDHFFVSTGESKANVTAARLPYFDGDYWPGAAEDMIMQLQQEEEDGWKLQKKGKTKKPATKRASKVAGHSELASNTSKDLQLMHKLGDSIHPMKEDFIMVHLQYACTLCCNFIVSGHRWVCRQCKNFHTCDRCYEAELKLDERDRHPANSKEAHQLFSVEVNDVPADTKDQDEIMESEFFDTRQAFLSLCQGNHYQYDTLRRAKHSSMMVLYHLHNPTAPAFVTTCNLCHHDIETGQGWRCETCPDFDLCNACYQKGDSVKHPHKLSPHPSVAEREAQSKEARQQRVIQLRKMLDLLVHASQCCSAQCLYPNCRRVKGLFRHGMNCKIRASGGCPLCKKMWYLLQLHARACKESECRVPRCKDLKEHLRRLQQQMESRRRAAVKEMMRQRAAEAAGSAC